MQAQSVRSYTAAGGEVLPGRLPYVPGLDGLRALAVIAVLFYHADLPVYGGYLGVESFFVISGFLITALLIADWENHGRVRLRSFWVRRARRLLPALFILLAGVLLFTTIVLPAELTSLTGDTLAAVGYVTNWHLIVSEQSYFDPVERPSLLQHLWSLAVEEQFYILWPLLFGAGMRFLRPRGTLAAMLLGAAGSLALMAILADPGADPSRVYYGTDTRAAPLLLGAALAMVWSPSRAPALTRPGAGVALDLAGLLALGGLLVAYALLSEQHPLLYRGGLALVSLATAVAVAAASHPAARIVPWLLERRSLRWIGLRSYSLYLWHWPIFMVTRPGVDLAYDSWVIQLVRFALAFALAALSYSFVELPIRRGALGFIWQALWRKLLVGEPQPWPAWHPHAWYRRWAPAIAASLLALGVTYVGVNVSHAAVHNTVGDAHTLTAAPRAPAVSASATAGTPNRIEGPERDGQTSSEPAVASDGQAPLEAWQDKPPGTSVEDAAQPTAPPADPEGRFDPALAAELQQILDATVADGRIPGMVLSVRLPDGSSWTGAGGLADRDTGAAMEPDVLVRIGSLSKMFTAVVVLQLVEEGKLDLDAPVATWLPDLLPDGGSITVRQLLQHTSGLYDYLEDRRLVSQAYAEPERMWTPQELVGYATRFPLSFAPGSPDSWDYSSTNFVVLGMLVEQVTGNTLAAELRQRIFQPLGLDHTYSVPPDSAEGPQASGYAQGDERPDISLSFGFATANIVTSIADLRRFGEALFSDELLQPATRTQMYRFVNGKGQYDMPGLEYGLGLMSNRLPLGPGADGRERSAEDGLVIGHIGGFGGFRAALWYSPNNELLIALTVNQTSADPNDLAAPILDALLRYEERVRE
jgi:peptidoglycan/LPS O-acetylase OafA/YrhL/CubicO group peptidase (beta-lactamase class C family)